MGDSMTRLGGAKVVMGMDILLRVSNCIVLF